MAVFACVQVVLTGGILLGGNITMVDDVEEKAGAVLSQDCDTFLVPSGDLDELGGKWQQENPRVQGVTHMADLISKTLEGVFPFIQGMKR